MKKREIEKEEIVKTALDQFAQWWEHNSDGLKAQLTALTKKNLGSDLNEMVQNAAAALIKNQIAEHHKLMGNVLNQMRKDVRKNFKKLEKEVWIKQTQQWKKEFLATLTDRMMNSCNMLNEYFVMKLAWVAHARAWTSIKLKLAKMMI